MRNLALPAPNAQPHPIAIFQIPLCHHGGPGNGPSPVKPATVANADCISARERQVLIGVAQGETNKQMALRLNLSRRTVETYRMRVMRKLNIRSVAGLTQFAFSHGWITLPDELFGEIVSRDNLALPQARAA